MTDLLYPLDPNGDLASNTIPPEVHQVSGSELDEYNFFLPRVGPFYSKDIDGNDLKLYHHGSSRYLEYGTEFIYGFKHALASLNTARTVYGAVVILDTTLTGEFEFGPYQTLGGEFVINEATSLLLLDDKTRNPRHVTWEQIAGNPYEFPPIEHHFDWEALKGTDEVIAALNALTAQITLNGETESNLRAGIISEITGGDLIAGYETLRSIGIALEAIADSSYQIYLSEVMKTPFDWKPVRYDLKAGTHVCSCLSDGGTAVSSFFSDGSVVRTVSDDYGHVTQSELAGSVSYVPKLTYESSDGVLTMLMSNCSVRSASSATPNFSTLVDSSVTGTISSILYNLNVEPTLVASGQRAYEITETGLQSINVNGVSGFKHVVKLDGVHAGKYLGISSNNEVFLGNSSTASLSVAIDMSNVDDVVFITDGNWPGANNTDALLGLVKGSSIECVNYNGVIVKTMDIDAYSATTDLSVWCQDGLTVLTGSRTVYDHVGHPSGMTARPYRLCSVEPQRSLGYPIENLDERDTHSAFGLVYHYGMEERAYVSLDEIMVKLIINR